MTTNNVYLIRLDFNYMTTLSSAFFFSFFLFPPPFFIMEPPKFNFTRYQEAHFVNFEAFRNQMPDKYCAFCMQLLYPEEVHFLYWENVELLPCIRWRQPPCFDEQYGKIVVCNAHRKKQGVPSFVYPGPPFSLELNYRERSCLSPIKIMSQTTRKLSSSRVFCGHYEVSGSIWTRHNLEFAQMLYGGALGIPYVREMMANMNLERVREAFQALLQANAWLHPYRTMPVAERMQVMFEEHVRGASRDHPQASFGWTHNYAMPANDVNPQAGEQSFDNLLLGTDVFDNDVSYKDYPGVLCLIFPYLYTSGTGYYSFCSGNDQRSESEGGIAQANKDKETLKMYTKSRILMADRRFGQCPKFIFFMLDMIEKHNIQSANRHVIATKPDVTYTKASILNSDNTLNMQLVSLVPHTIRSSYAYKRRHALNLQAVFQHLGAPQLFITISCDDFASEYRRVCGGDPWTDPVAFARHFKRNFQQIFQKYIRGGSFERMVGGITDWSWTMEIQDRGSPHIHMVLWIGLTREELLEKDDLVVCRIPDENHDEDLYELVLRHQIHRYTNYCSWHRTSREEGSVKKCRFGFPKPDCLFNHFDPNTGRTIYKRTVEDAYINNYNPYLLKLLRVSMDIQVNNSGKVLDYLAKYLSKPNTHIDIQYNMSTASDYFRARILGSIEAVYHICGWNLHRSSRGCVFISTNMPNHDERRQLKKDILDLPDHSSDIFSRRHVTKYEDRHFQVAELTMVEYFTYYHITKEMDIED